MISDPCFVYSHSFITEITGIAFSPDGKYMYFAFQKEGLLFEATRTDGLSFHSKTAPSAGGCSLTSLLGSPMRFIKSAWSGIRQWVVLTRVAD